jgi:hypothetical protein
MTPGILIYLQTLDLSSRPYVHCKINFIQTITFLFLFKFLKAFPPCIFTCIRFLGSVEVQDFKGNEVLCSAMKEVHCIICYGVQ